MRLGVLRPVIWKQDKIRRYMIVWASPRQEENAVLIQGNRFLMVKTSGTLLAASEKLQGAPVLSFCDADLPNFLSLPCILVHVGIFQGIYDV